MRNVTKKLAWNATKTLSGIPTSNGESSKINAQGLPKSSPGNPQGSQNRRWGYLKCEKKSNDRQSVTQGPSWEGSGRDPGAPMVDFGGHSGSQGRAAEHFGYYFVVQLAARTPRFLGFRRHSFLVLFFQKCLMISGMYFEMELFCFFVAEGVPLPSMILIRFFSFCGLPSRSENLRRSAFYTVNTMVFVHSAFSENLIVLVYFLDMIIDFAMRFCVASLKEKTQFRVSISRQLSGKPFGLDFCEIWDQKSCFWPPKCWIPVSKIVT